MNLSGLFVVAAIVHALYGVSFALVPQIVLEQHGMAATPGFIMLARVMGAALIGYAVIFWWSRNAPESETRLAIVRGACVWNLIAIVVVFYGVTAGVMNVFGWVPVIVHLVFAAAFGYFGFIRR